MKVEMIRSRLFEGQTLEAGRVVDVPASFGAWLIGRGMAVPYTNRLIPEVIKNRGRPAKGNPKVS